MAYNNLNHPDIIDTIKESFDVLKHTQQGLFIKEKEKGILLDKMELAILPVTIAK